MLFARDKSVVGFIHNGYCFEAYLQSNSYVYVAAKGTRTPNKQSKCREARQWFIDHQHEFNLEGYQ